MKKARTIRKVVVANKAYRMPLFVFNGPTDAERCFGMGSGSVQYQCKHKTLSHKTDLYFRYADEFDPREMFEAKLGCPVYARHGNKVRVFNTITEMAKAMGILKDRAAKSMQRGEFKGIELGYLTNGLGGLNGSYEEGADGR